MISNHRVSDSPSRPFNDFYRDKRVLVTGHTGFKGSWLSLWLTQLGARVAGFSSYLPSKPCNFEIVGLQDLIEDIRGDIRNFDEIKSAFDHFQPQIVFHLAAQPIVLRSYDEPKLTFDTNLGGTVNILECIRLSESVESAVLITSDKCYKNAEWTWGYRENDLLGGDDPYSASKGCAEFAIQSYGKCFFVQSNKTRIASARAGNVIGGGDWAEDRAIPDCVRAWSEGREVIVRNPHATRPWQHVLEPLSGYLWLGAILGLGDESIRNEAFNFGPKSDVIQSVNILIETFHKHWDNSKWKIIATQSNKKESGLLKLSCDKALSLLNWQAILSFDKTIELTAMWYKAFFDRNDNMFSKSVEQITSYTSLAERRCQVWAIK